MRLLIGKHLSPMKLRMTHVARRAKLFLFFLLLMSTARAGSFRLTDFQPGIHLGYVIGARLAFGAELNYQPLHFRMNARDGASGLYASWTYFYANGELYVNNLYRTFSFGPSATIDEQYALRAGLAKTLLRWGLKKRNKTKSKSWGLDIDASYRLLPQGIFLGYRFYGLQNACFGLDIKRANIFYAAYRYAVDKE